MEATGTLLRALAGGQAVRLLAVELSAVAEHARVAHGLGPDAARVAAEGVVATALLAAHVKGDDRLMLQLHGERPRVAFIGEIDGQGALRARLTPPDLHLPADGCLEGSLIAVKSDAVREVYRGHSAIDHETLEQALGRYLGDSQQVDAILRIFVRLDDAGAVCTAGGLLVERLPEHPEHPSLDHRAFDDAFGILREAPLDPVLAEIATGGLLAETLHPLDRRTIVWRCRCSLERVEATLAGLGPRELQEMADEDHGAEVTCHFCNTTYHVSEARLRALI